ncbi:ATP-binding protein [Roseibium alexandrii]|uniref:histidine kinase n=1 Tax=Roseibium alexandrii (strain DSM 17067 / NCIMB 14079 / DFL-11) TaxID=244592 RepID=A0A5E8GTM0_ROSAD|nr:ATP-binding protein [Roseibium alexandrii]EEE43199.1 PAS domain S-box [Roseibium alexandrii DFL-11]
MRFDLADEVWMTALDAAQICITIADAKTPGRPLVYVNPAFLRQTGYSLEEAVGRNCGFLQGPDTDPHTVFQLRESLEAEMAICVEVLNYKKDGTPFWNALSISPIKTATGDLVAFVGFQTDVTDRRAASLEEQHSEKMAALGRFAGGIAHQVNSALQPVVSLPALIAPSLPMDKTEERDWLELIETSGKAARTLLKSVLAFSRGREFRDAKLFHPNEVFDLALRHLRIAAPPGVRITSSHRVRGTLALCGDPVALTNALVELGQNALDALDGAGEVRLSLEEVGNRVEICVQDTGPGLDARTRSRLFEPFYTTKPIGQGTGLGLALVHSTVEAFSGSIAVETRSGTGTRFVITLPVEPFLVPVSAAATV